MKWKTTLAFFFVVSNLWSQTVIWDGDKGDGKWESPTNWDGDVLPCITCDVLIDNAFVQVNSAPKVNSLKLLNTNNNTQLNIESAASLTLGSANGNTPLIINAGVLVRVIGSLTLSNNIGDELIVNDGGEIICDGSIVGSECLKEGYLGSGGSRLENNGSIHISKFSGTGVTLRSTSDSTINNGTLVIEQGEYGMQLIGYFRNNDSLLVRNTTNRNILTFNTLLVNTGDMCLETTTNVNLELNGPLQQSGTLIILNTDNKLHSRTIILNKDSITNSGKIELIAPNNIVNAPTLEMNSNMGSYPSFVNHDSLIFDCRRDEMLIDSGRFWNLGVINCNRPTSNSIFEMDHYNGEFINDGKILSDFGALFYKGSIQISLGEVNSTTDSVNFVNNGAIKGSGDLVGIYCNGTSMVNNNGTFSTGRLLILNMRQGSVFNNLACSVLNKPSISLSNSSIMNNWGIINDLKIPSFSFSPFAGFINNGIIFDPDRVFSSVIDDSNVTNQGQFFSTHYGQFSVDVKEKPIIISQPSAPLTISSNFFTSRNLNQIAGTYNSADQSFSPNSSALGIDSLFFTLSLGSTCTNTLSIPIEKDTCDLIVQEGFTFTGAEDND